MTKSTPPPTNRAGDTRALLLSAATVVIHRDGVNHLTLDAVAREAGVSKGGLLYHYPSKHHLIVGLLQAYLDDFERRIVQHTAQGASYPRAFVQATLDELQDERVKASTAALLAIVTHEPELLTRFRQAADGWQTQLEQSGLDPARATVARLAVEGLYFAELMGAAVPQGALRIQIEQVLLDLTSDVT